MRGVVSAGMVLGLEQLGLLNSFDAVFGSSAGAMNGAYFLAGQAAVGTTIYYENINNRNFINPWRFLGKSPVADIDFAVFNVMVNEKPLNTSRILKSKIPLYVVATNVEEAKVEILSDFQDSNDLLGALRAGATMPIVAGPPYPYRDGQYWDPLFFEDTIPVSAALDRGYTHVVALLTRPDGPLQRRVSLAEKAIVVPQIRKYSERLATQYRRREAAYATIVDRLVRSEGDLSGTVLSILSKPPLVSKLGRNRETLVAGARRGAEAVFSHFIGNGHFITQTLRGFSLAGDLIGPLYTSIT